MVLEVQSFQAVEAEGGVECQRNPPEDDVEVRVSWHKRLVHGVMGDDEEAHIEPREQNDERECRHHGPNMCKEDAVDVGDRPAREDGHC